MIRALAILLPLAAPALSEETRDEAVYEYFAQADASAEKPWKIEGSFGLTVKDGNTELVNFAARALFEKRWPRDLLRLTLQSIYSEEESVETASEHIGVQRYERYFGEKHRLWQTFWLETDSQEALSYRAVLTVGYGYRFRKTETFELWGELGGGVEHESFYGDEENTEGIAQVSVEWTWQITENLTYRQVISFWPSLSEGGEYKLIWDSKFTLPVSERWAFELIVQDKYDSDPEPGIENNDLTVIFTLTFNFTKKEKK